ncbi:hypothetical protein V2J09_016424 [Rumex salicifolius]
MSAAKRRSSVKQPEKDVRKPEKRAKQDLNLLDNQLSSEIKGIMSALHQIKEKAQKDGQKKHDEMMSSISSEIQSMFDEMKTKIEKDRLAFAKSLAKSFKECETALKEENARFEEIHEKFSKEKTAHLQMVKDAMSKFEEEKGKLMKRYEQQSESIVPFPFQMSPNPQREKENMMLHSPDCSLLSEKKDKILLSEHEKASAEKIAVLEQSLKKKQTTEVNPFNILKKMMMTEEAEDDHFTLDD